MEIKNYLSDKEMLLLNELWEVRRYIPYLPTQVGNAYKHQDKITSFNNPKELKDVRDSLIEKGLIRKNPFPPSFEILMTRRGIFFCSALLLLQEKLSEYDGEV